MKYIIVGLGNFGASLAQKLTENKNEVIAIDDSLEKVEYYKEKITHTIRMDATDENTVSGLPISNTDIVIIAIGEDEGANVMTTALFKNLNAKRIISRSITPLHEKVLTAIGVDDIVRPEQESAEKWSKKLSLQNIVDSFELGVNFSIVEAKIPKKYAGQSIREMHLRRKFNILVLTVIEAKNKKETESFQLNEKIEGITDPDNIVKENDVLVLFGANKDLKNFLNQELK